MTLATLAQDDNTHWEITMKRVTLALLALALAGCSESTTPSLKCGIAGTSDANVAGAVTVSVDGCAQYGVSTGTGASTAITLNAGSLAATTHTIVLTHSGARPANGNYPVGTPTGNNFSGWFTLEAGSADRTFVLTGGTIDITTSTDGKLNGTFNAVTATEGTPAAPTVTITGNFAAKCVSTSGSTC